MKWCESCGVKVKGSHEYCPLCDAKLICTKEETMDEFPREYPINKQKSRMLKLASILLCLNGIICVLINTIYPTSINWSMIVVVVLVSVRIGLGIAVAKHGRVLKHLFQQSILIVGMSIGINYIFAGDISWAISYILPNVCSFMMIVMYAFSKILNMQAGEYMIYFMIDTIFGILPVAFIRLNLVTTVIPSLVCIGISLISIGILLLFEGEIMYSELKRRLHV